MNESPYFLTVAEIIRIHDAEIAAAGGSYGIRDNGALDSAAFAPQASFDGRYLMDEFEMAATYVCSFAFDHPFIDGNKRVALASALTFLYICGYEVEEAYDEGHADAVLSLLAHKMTKADLAAYFKARSKEI